MTVRNKRRSVPRPRRYRRRRISRPPQESSWSAWVVAACALLVMGLIIHEIRPVARDSELRSTRKEGVSTSVTASRAVDQERNSRIPAPAEVFPRSDQRTARERDVGIADTEVVTAQVTRQRSSDADTQSALHVRRQNAGNGQVPIVVPANAPPVNQADAKSDVGIDLTWTEGPSGHAYAAKEHKLKSFSFTVPSAMSTHSSLQCDVTVPVDASGRILPSAADVVALFPYPTEKSAVEGFARPLAARYGFTIFTLRFPGMWPNADIDPGDRSVFYYFPESGSGQAWLSAYDAIVERLGIPRRKWFCFGRSGGGSAAHLFAEAHPDLVEAYAQEAGRVFAERPTFLGPLLSVSGEYDYVKPETDLFVASLKASGSDPFVLTFRPNWGGRAQKNPIYRHSMPNEYADAVWRWFAGLADMRQQADGILPPRSQWPLVDGARVPSAAFAEAVAKLPAATQIVPHDGRDFQHSQPRPGALKRRVLLVSRSYLTHPEDVLLNGQYLADHGYEVLGLQAIGGGQFTTPRRIEGRAVPWTMEAAILEEPTEGDLRALRAVQPRPNLLILIRASSRVLQEWERIGWKGAHVLAFSRSVEVAPPGVEIRPLPSKVKGPGDWHGQVMQSIVSWLNAQKGERRP